MSAFDAIDSIKFKSTCCGCNNTYRQSSCLSFVENIIDISPRHQDLSHVPLEVLEAIQYFYNNKSIKVKVCDMWFHPFIIPHRDSFGTVRNWFQFSSYKIKEYFTILSYSSFWYWGSTIGFLINIKDLRVAIYIDNNNHCTIFKYAFDSYDEYLKEKDLWSKLTLTQDSAHDFAFYWAIKKGYIEQ